ncbi:MAG: hypothetical protein H7201_03790 [Candidatus Saccharibacteria bacterium]|nr:hypothetical protein [Microbacteriaceae bacterium]
MTAAEAIVRSLPDNGTHTVASAAMDTMGNGHTRVNVFHFTGGPCAELVVIAAAAQALAGPLVSIVAVGDRDRGVLAPRGRALRVVSPQTEAPAGQITFMIDKVNMLTQSLTLGATHAPLR